MGNKRKAMDDADDQAKRMKQVLHISRGKIYLNNFTLFI
jgi:hypothetical protein